MASITIEIPSGLEGIFGNSPEERARFAKEAVVIEAYRRSMATKSSLGAVVGVARVDFQEWLSERGVPDNGTADDLAEGYRAGEKFLSSKG